MVLLEHNNRMEQLGINTQLNFTLTPGIKQEPCQTSPLSDKENLQISTQNLSEVAKQENNNNNNNNRKRPGLFQNSSSSGASTPRLNPQSIPITKTKQMGRRNARERNRVRYLNMTFEHLRQHLPQKTNSKGKAKKMSKVDTLRGAIDYIRGLQELLDDNDAVNAVFQSGSLTTALSEADTLSPTHSAYSTDGSPCSLPGQSPHEYSTAAPGAEYSMSTSAADSALFSEEDGDDFIDITSWLQC